MTVANACAGPFGAFYDFYIERPRLAQAIGRTVWGIDLAPLYASMELVQADMQALPLPDATADLCLGYSGLHMVADPARTLAELVRCLKPGGELVGSTFLAEGARRRRGALGHGERTGQNGPRGWAPSCARSSRRPAWRT